MNDYDGLLKRLERGASNIHEANNLLAEAYSAIGRLTQKRPTPLRDLVEEVAMRKDADRYRWLRNQDGYEIVAHCGKELDRMVDGMKEDHPHE